MDNKLKINTKNFLALIKKILVIGGNKLINGEKKNLYLIKKMKH